MRQVRQTGGGPRHASICVMQSRAIKTIPKFTLGECKAFAPVGKLSEDFILQGQGVVMWEQR